MKRVLSLKSNYNQATSRACTLTYNMMIEDRKFNGDFYFVIKTIQNFFHPKIYMRKIIPCIFKAPSIGLIIGNKSL